MICPFEVKPAADEIARERGPDLLRGGDRPDVVRHLFREEGGRNAKTTGRAEPGPVVLVAQLRVTRLLGGDVGGVPFVEFGEGCGLASD